MRPVALFAATGAAAVAALAGCLVPLPPSAAHDAVRLLLAMIATLAGTVVASYAWQARGHHRLTTAMRRLALTGELAGQRVDFVPGLGSPFVAGLWSPRIFCGSDLAAHLDEEELHAVLLHERHHQRDRAPLRLVGVAALAPALGRTRAGRAWLERRWARVEIAADRYAVMQGASRAAIARALLKLPPVDGVGWAPGFSTAGDLRVRALLGEETEPDGRGWWPRTLPAVVLLAACLAILLA